jgi:hypothetical protein
MPAVSVKQADSTDVGGSTGDHIYRDGSTELTHCCSLLPLMKSEAGEEQALAQSTRWREPRQRAAQPNEPFRQGSGLHH